jgi:energy-coupling factor transporter ATP-binding protein EcfA2
LRGYLYTSSLKGGAGGQNGAEIDTDLALTGILSGERSRAGGGHGWGPKTWGGARRQRGLVFQSPEDQLFSPTVFEDVAFGPIHQAQKWRGAEAVEEALGAVHMLEYAERVSHHLSIGEKKRIAIATVLSMKPEILVLDEPTAGLDPRARRSLIHLLDELDITMLVSTHDMLLVSELFPRVVVMDEGKIVADGPTRELLQDPALLEAHGLERPNI